MLAVAVRGKRCRIAILLPAGWHGGMVRSAWALADLLGGLRAPDGRSIEVVVGLRRDGGYDWDALEARARSAPYPLSVRRLVWANKSPRALNAMAARTIIPERLVSHGVLPCDGLHDFMDCEAWITFGTSMEGYVPPIRPRAVFCADHIGRYVTGPDDFMNPIRKTLMDETFLGWRHSLCVFSTTPRTASDTVSFAGVPGARVMLLPTLVDPIRGVVPPLPQAPGERILWVTNPSRHKNHLMALEALRLYWTQLHGTMDVTVCGAFNESLRPGRGSDHPFARALEQVDSIIDRFHFAGETDDATFLRKVSESAFVWHNVVIDNGTFVAFDAARAGRHFVSSDYPQMRYLAERYGIEVSWFSSSDPKAAAQALLSAEQKVRAGQTPNHALRADDPAERARAYQGLVNVLMAA